MLQSRNCSYIEACNTFSDLYLIAARGVGQGDTPSPFIWDAFFDILLVALKIGAQGNFWLRASGDRLVEMRDTAYADDLLSPTSELQLLQRKANIVSAFAMIFGLEISITKLRSLFMEWGNEIPVHLLPKVEIHQWGWVPCEVGLGWVIPPHGEPLPTGIGFSSITI